MFFIRIKSYKRRKNDLKNVYLFINKIVPWSISFINYLILKKAFHMLQVLYSEIDGLHKTVAFLINKYV